MAYPDPILPLAGKDAKKFWEELENFEVSREQKARIQELREKLREKLGTDE